VKTLDTLTICGAGLIGGSVALAARRAGVVRRLIAIDRASAPSTHPFDLWLEQTDHESVERAFAESTLILLCTPVRAIIAALPAALRSGAIVSDCGSTKLAIATAARSCPGSERFVPSHPMAGRPVGGLEHASAELFDARRWLICPEGAGPAALSLVDEFVRALGAVPVELSAREHDHSVAVTSHLPQVLASALAALADSEQALSAAGPGFASATRVAGGAESMWSDIFATNGGEIGRALRLLARELEVTGRGLENGDASLVLGLLERARAARKNGD